MFDNNVVIKDSNLLVYKISVCTPIVYNIDTVMIQFAKAFNVHFYKKDTNILIRK